MRPWVWGPGLIWLATGFVAGYAEACPALRGQAPPNALHNERVVAECFFRGGKPPEDGVVRGRGAAEALGDCLPFRGGKSPPLTFEV